MKLEEKIHVLRFLSGILNSIFLILGLSIFGCAVWILFDQSSFLSSLSSDELKTVAGGLFVIGLVVVAVFAVGCAGAQAESRFLMITYMSLLVVLVLGQVFVALVLFLNKDRIGASLDATIDNVIVDYGNTTDRKPHLDMILDNVQRYGRCCGRTNPADWLENSFIQNMPLPSRPEEAVLPCSCFNSTRCPVIPGSDTLLFGLGNNSYVEGCEAQISEWLEENALTVLGMDASLILIQVLQFIVFVYLYQRVGQKARLKRAKTTVHQTPDAQHDPHDEQYDPEDQLYQPEYEPHDSEQYYLDQGVGYGAENQGYIYDGNGYIEPPPQEQYQ